MARAEQLGVGSAVSFLGEMDQINQRRRARVVDITRSELGGLTGKKVLVLGAAFKPDSDDLRDSPAIAVANQISDEGADVTIHDPMALARIPEIAPRLTPNVNLFEAAKDADAVVLATEWQVYKDLDPNKLPVKNRLIIDGRNALNVEKWQQAGWKLIALGRNVHL